MTVHEPSNATAGPLTGVRVLDLSRVLAAAVSAGPKR